MKNLKNSKTSGISLVALIVTIIVLIILTAAVIVTFMEGGIIEKAKEAVFKSDIRTYQEILAVKNAENMINLATENGEGGLYNETEYEKIKEIIPEFKEEYKDLIAISNGEIVLGSRTEAPYSTWLSELGIGENAGTGILLAKVEGLEVGHYVAYNPGNDELTYTLLGTDSGYYISEDGQTSYMLGDNVAFIDQEITRQTVNWRVLKNDGNQVTLISETPIDNIGLGGDLGYTNGPAKLDEIYDTLYSKSGVGTARNLNEDDVNEAMEVVIGDDVKIYYDESEENTGIEIEYGTVIRAVPVTYYSYNGENFKEGHEKEYELIFNGVYWLSSTYGYTTLVDSFDITGLKIINNKYIDRDGGIFNATDGYQESLRHPGRPIVVLNSNVALSATNTGDGSSASSAWQLQ